MKMIASRTIAVDRAAQALRFSCDALSFSKCLSIVF